MMLLTCARAPASCEAMLPQKFSAATTLKPEPPEPPPVPTPARPQPPASSASAASASPNATVKAALAEL